MFVAKIPEGAAVDEMSLGEVQATISALASGLDARFVEAGTALATVYDIIEKLVASLEGVTNAMDRDSAAAAVENMRATADRLVRLPELQARRQQDLAAVRQSSRDLGQHIEQVRKTLSFLRICGLNIKITAAGAVEFSGFAENMLDRLEQGEGHLAGFEQELGELAARIAGMAEAEALLAAECAKVIPHVPMKLAEDARALQGHQADLADLAARIAQVAREIRAKVATALGALQIGDITRQRLEHIAAGLLLVTARLEERKEEDAAANEALRGHVLALLSAQAEDTIEDFQREARLLAASLRGVAPDAARLLALRGAHHGAEDGQTFLHVLEQGIAEVESVTGQLRAADDYSDRLSAATSETAESLARRLKAVRNVQIDVEQMAWNTGLRCRRMGDEGKALEVVAKEIRVFANNLETVSGRITGTFEQLSAAAGSMRARGAEGAGVDAGRALSDSLAAIRVGGRRMAESLARLDGDAATMVGMLRDTTAKVDCEGEIGEALLEAADRLAGFVHFGEGLRDAVIEPLREMLDAIARSYTMASEREVHKRFALPGDEETSEAEAPAAGISDDDLFDDALF